MASHLLALPCFARHSLPGRKPGMPEARHISIMNPPTAIHSWTMIPAIVLSAALLGGCTSVKPVNTYDIARLPTLVKSGDRVDCILVDGSKVRLTVIRTEPDALVSNERRVPVATITHAEIRRLSPGKTILLVAGVAVAGAAAYGLSNLAFFPAMAPFAP